MAAPVSLKKLHSAHLGRCSRQYEGEKGRGRKHHHCEPHERLMREVIPSGVKTKVFLLSATPVNTGLKIRRGKPRGGSTPPLPASQILKGL